jgi:hypothetical protein
LKLLIKTLDTVLAALAHARIVQQVEVGTLNTETDDIFELLHYLSDAVKEEGGKSYISEIYDRVMAIIEENGEEAAREV